MKRIPPTSGTAQASYEPPRLTELGTLSDVTLGCDKRFGPSDGFTFQGNSITCTSA